MDQPRNFTLDEYYLTARNTEHCMNMVYQELNDIRRRRNCRRSTKGKDISRQDTTKETRSESRGAR